MSLTSEKSANGEVLTIIINGEFDSSMAEDFRQILRNQEAGEYRIDMQNADYIDSSALGMLLILREHANSSSSTVNIVNSNERLKRILKIAKFDQLFSIQQ